MNEQLIRDVALQEVLQQRLASTKQYLAVNIVVCKEGVPVIADVICEPTENVARVYFPIESQQYYLVVILALEPHLTASYTITSPGTIVDFGVTSETHSLEELLSLTQIKPTRIWRKGEKNGWLPRHNGFEVRLAEKETGEVEDKLTALLDALLPFASDLPRLASIATMGISIVYYGYQEAMGGIYLDEETIGKLAKLHVPIDIDLYASGPDLKSYG